MKNIAVICDDKREWREFIEQYIVLSEVNAPFKYQAGSLVDIDKNIKYILVPNCYKGIDNIRGYVISNYFTIAKIVDNDVHDYIMAHMREDI